MGRYLDLLREAPAPGAGAGPAIKAIKATEPGLQSLSSLMSRSEMNYSDPGFWRELHEERVAVRQYNGGYRRDEAEGLAWGELQNRWHMTRGERVSRELCAGCRRPIGNAEALDMIDGNRVHLAILDCLIRHGERWRAAATRALIAIGLRPPVGALWTTFNNTLALPNELDAMHSKPSDGR
jgi:hypothetical protein